MLWIQDAIRDIANQAIVDGYEGIALVGESDLEFMVEHICHKENISYRLISSSEQFVCKWFYIYAETKQLVDSGEVESSNTFSLNELLRL